ncbi:glycoside hydrolase family 20 zincin-like fold domain-containing protein [Flavobacterium procerum]|uniref:glycoside hydrolase family 20 zincin-like fold domain-containing protein n=1 Tax=Flavobacterium procerum TaxID=1455569 RepID=UPI0035EC57B0
MFFEFTKDTKFVVNGDFQKDAANALASKFETVAGWKPETTTKAPASNFVQFKIDPNLKNEAYVLDVNPTNIVISAKGNVGFSIRFRKYQTITSRGDRK